jgi:hypothetical protein
VTGLPLTLAPQFLLFKDLLPHLSIAEHGKENGASEHISGVEHAFHEDQGGGGRRERSNKGEATTAAQKGGQHSHGGRKR